MVEAGVIFLLFFAVLAFAWFYLQRAKTRTSTTDVDAHPAADKHPVEPVNRPIDPAP